MKNHKNNEARPEYLKRKLTSALCMLLIASVLLGSASYAWLVMSVAPEVSGMTANVGANGSLEIALLDSETRQDLSLISSMGGSLATRNPSANKSWGNVLDLSYDDYGLQEMVLWPSRLNLVQAGDKYIVDSSLLSVPTYGYDGRIIELTDDTVTGSYKGGKFTTILGVQDYGVRIVGTANSLSPQNTALALAKSNIKTYMNSAKQAASAAMDSSGDGLMNIMMDRTRTYTDEDVKVLEDLIKNLQISLDYIDLALRQGMVAAAASVIANEDTFNDLKDMIQDDTKTLSELMLLFEGTYEIDAGYSLWIDEFEETQNSLNNARNTCNNLSGNSYTWADLRPIFDCVMNVDKVYINDEPFSNFDSSKVNELLGGNVVVTLAPESGVFADIADFTGNYSSWVTYIVKIEITTETLRDPVYLQALANVVENMEGADGSVVGESSVELTTTFGYCVDMAFRTNAVVSDLLLQTTPSQRVYADSTNQRTMGGGSYMEFVTDDETFSVDKMLELMDAVRVAFVDDQGVLLGIAKLNTSNRVVNGERVKAPLYLYSFHIDEEDGSLQMDVRQKTANVLTALEQNTAKAVSAIVWLDGDIVDNSMVSATEETSLRGTLNLQFASSANLVAAGNNSMANITADKSDLAEKITTEKPKIDAGQGLYTTESWEAFVNAYEYAVSVNNNEGANEHQIYVANAKLQAAADALDEVDHESLVAKIEQIRELMGSSDKIHSLLFYDEETDSVIDLGTYDETTEELTYTQDMLDKATISYGVDYQKNFHDEGNGVLTQIYTDETWVALAAALYAAERVGADPNATDSELDTAITALETAYDALERTVYYIPYDYEGSVYYLAVSDIADTYGKWYDSEFKRVTSDLLILKLDAKADQITDIGKINQNYYVSSTSGFITPEIEFYEEIYTQLQYTIKALMWNLPDQFALAITGDQFDSLISLINWAEGIKAPADNADAKLKDMYTRIKANLLAARAIQVKGNTATFDEAAALIPVFTALKNEYELYIFESAMSQEEYEHYIAKYSKEYATADQITVLTVAINSGKSVVGWNTEDSLKDLKAAIEAAEALLTSVSDPDFRNRPSVAQANEALNNLNAQLKANGLNEVTVGNYITHTVPTSQDTYEQLYVVQNNPMAGIVMSGEIGETSIEVVILTDSGVVFKIKKDIMVYSPAAGSEISYDESYDTNPPLGGGFKEYKGVPKWEPVIGWDKYVQVGESLKFAVDLSDRQIPVLDENGLHAYELYEQKDDTGKVIKTENHYLYSSIEHTEKVIGYTWASSDTSVAMVTSYAANGECRVKAVGVGDAIISVTVTTEQGNEYVDTFIVHVNDVNVSGDFDLDIGDTTSVEAIVSQAAKYEYVYEWSCEENSVIKLSNTDQSKIDIDALSSGVVTLTLTVTDVETINKPATQNEDPEATEPSEPETEKVVHRTFRKVIQIAVLKLPIEDVTLTTDKQNNDPLNIGDAINMTIEVTPTDPVVEENTPAATEATEATGATGATDATEGEEEKVVVDLYEDVVSCTWTVVEEESNVVTLEPDGMTCKATAVGEGTVTISVTIVTERGDSYTKNMNITVATPPEVTEPAETTAPTVE